jgi:hypothetical protein
MDMEAIERCILWTLGIAPESHIQTSTEVAVEANV